MIPLENAITNGMHAMSVAAGNSAVRLMEFLKSGRETDKETVSAVMGSVLPSDITMRALWLAGIIDHGHYKATGKVKAGPFVEKYMRLMEEAGAYALEQAGMCDCSECKARRETKNAAQSPAG